jgi:hypothetical protein
MLYEDIDVVIVSDAVLALFFYPSRPIPLDLSASILPAWHVTSDFVRHSAPVATSTSIAMSAIQHINGKLADSYNHLKFRHRC